MRIPELTNQYYGMQTVFYSVLIPLAWQQLLLVPLVRCLWAKVFGRLARYARWSIAPDCGAVLMAQCGRPNGGPDRELGLLFRRPRARRALIAQVHERVEARTGWVSRDAWSAGAPECLRAATWRAGCLRHRAPRLPNGWRSHGALSTRSCICLWCFVVDCHQMLVLLYYLPGMLADNLSEPFYDHHCFDWKRPFFGGAKAVTGSRYMSSSLFPHKKIMRRMATEPICIDLDDEANHMIVMGSQNQHPKICRNIQRSDFEHKRKKHLQGVASRFFHFFHGP